MISTRQPSSPTTKPPTILSDRILIIGGGAIGLSTAWELARRGCAVTLLERNQSVGRATSWSAAGILPPANFETATDPIDRLRGLSHNLFPEWVANLQATTGIDPGLRRCGGWYLANTPGEKASMIGMTDYWQSLEIECQPISSDELAKQEPALSNAIVETAAAWWVPDEYQLRCPDHLKALETACQIAGVEIKTDAKVTDLRWNADSVSAQCDDVWLDADHVVVCGGAWTGLVADELGLESSLIPVRGQIMLFQTDTPLLRGIVNVGHRYVLCRDDGNTLVGSCEEEVGFQLGTTEVMLETLRQFAVELVPELEGATIAKSWSGLRPLTFDGFPMIGPIPQCNRVHIAAGHFRSGIHLSPATATVIADNILGVPPKVDLDPFRVGKQQHQPITQPNSFSNL